jgi:MFS family permease
MNKTKVLVLTTIFIDVVGLGIIIPILPFYVEHFTSSAVVITSLYAVYALLSFFSAPVIGAISDRIGRKKALLASIFSTSAGWVLFALAPSVPFLFLGRIIDGAAAGNMPIAQAYLADMAKTDQERTSNFGLMGAVFGIAFIIGPMIGGLLGAVSQTFPFWFVGALAFVNAVMGIFFLPETHTNREHARAISLNPFKPLVRAAKNKKMLPNYVAWFLFGLAIATFQSLFSLFAQSAFGFGQLAIGIVFTGLGLVILFNQAFALKKFWLKHFSESKLELFLLGLFAFGFFIITFLSWTGLILGLIAVAICWSLLRAVMTSRIVAKTSVHEKGEALGITSSLTSLSAGLAPLAVGYLFSLNQHVLFIIASGFLIAAIGVLVLFQGKFEIQK